MRTPKETKMIVSRRLDQSHGGPQWPKVEMWGAVRKFLGHLCRAMLGRNVWRQWLCGVLLWFGSV